MVQAERLRCVAERRARWVRGAIDVGSGTAVRAFVAFSVLSAVSLAMPRNAGTPLAICAAHAPWLCALAFTLWCIALGLEPFLRVLTRRDGTPLPAPPINPLATYRQGGPVECPRHPFAR